MVIRILTIYEVALEFAFFIALAKMCGGGYTFWFFTACFIVHGIICRKQARQDFLEENNSD